MIPSIGRIHVMRWQHLWVPSASVFNLGTHPVQRAERASLCGVCGGLILVGAWSRNATIGAYASTHTTHAACAYKHERAMMQCVLGERLVGAWTPQPTPGWITLAEFYEVHPIVLENFALVMHAHTDSMVNLRVGETRMNLLVHVPQPRRFTRSYLPRLIEHYAATALRNL